MSDRQRRLTGLGLSLMVGFVYAVISTYINNIVLWGIPLRTETGAALANVVSLTFGAAAVGLLSAWPASSFKGVLAGAGGMALVGALRALGAQDTSEGVVRALLIFIPALLPAAALGLPLTFLLRWGTNMHLEALTHAGRVRWFRLGRLYLILLLLAGVVGSLARLGPAQEAALRQVDGLVRQGLAAASASELPEPLKNLTGFHGRAGGGYTLSAAVDQSADTSFADSTHVETIFVVVRFDTGYRFQCQITNNPIPLCSEP